MDYFNEFRFWSLAAHVSIMKNSTLKKITVKRVCNDIRGSKQHQNKFCENDPSK